MSTRLVLLFAVALLAAACSLAPKPAVVPETPQVRPPASTGPAVRSLMEKARAAAKAGKLDVAEAQLERALRIEPDNATLWHYLAKLRLNQGRLQQAAELAAKSNSMEPADPVLRADNWRLIAHARYRQGKTEAAREAQARADALATE